MTPSSRARSSRIRRPLGAVALLLVGALLAACGSSGDDNPAGVVVRSADSGSPFHGSLIEPPFDLPEVTLQDTDERTVGLADVMGPVTVMFFGYTNCPDVCNTQMAETASALRRMDDADRSQVKVVFVTTDPARDDAAALRSYLDHFDESFVGLTGKMTEIEAAAEGLGVALLGKKKLPSGGYEVDHGAQLIGFGAERTAKVVWTVGTPVGELREDLTTLVDQA